MTKSRNKGITLIALVITIIILLILAGISIFALTNQGLFKNAKIAQNATEKAEVEQGNILNEYEGEINKYLSNDGKTEEKLVDKVNDGTIKIGDYVKYTPDTASTDTILQELSTYSGSSDNTTSTLTQESLNWRVLDVKDGQVRLISEVPTTSTITLSSYKGYNNAVKLIDDTCKELYSNLKLASKVQNLKIEDIQNYLTYDYTQYENTNVDTGKYGGTKIYTDTSHRTYPNIFKKEKTGWVDEIQGNELDLSEQPELLNETKTQAEISLKMIQTYWGKSMVEDDFSNSIYYNLFINRGSNYSTYWISSRCLHANYNDVGFNVRIVDSGNVSANYLYYSGGEERLLTYAFRPVITLKSNVQIDTDNSGDGSTAEQAYIIK